MYGKGAGRDVKGKGRVKKESLHLDSPGESARAYPTRLLTDRTAPLQHILHSSLQPSIHSAFLSSSFASTSSSSIVSNASDDSYSPSSETENEFWTRYSGSEPDEVPYVPSPLESEFSYAHDPCLNASETLDYSYFTLPTVEIEQASYYHNPFSIFGQTSTFPPQTLVPPSPSYEPFMLPAHFSNPLHQNDTFSLPLYQHLKTGTGLIANFTPFGRLTLSDDAPLGGPAMGQYVV